MHEFISDTNPDGDTNTDGNTNTNNDNAYPDGNTNTDNNNAYTDGISNCDTGYDTNADSNATVAHGRHQGVTTPRLYFYGCHNQSCR